MGVLANRACMSVSGAPGTGPITLGSAASGCQTFSAAQVPTGAQVSYAVNDGSPLGSSWEIGLGTYNASAGTLTRTTILGDSSGTGSALTLTSVAQVEITPLASDFASTAGGLINKLRNGTMDCSQRLGSGLSNSVSTSGAYTLDGWFVLPAGAPVAFAQAAGRQLTAYSLQITGASGVTDVQVKHPVESLIAAPLTSQMVTFQAQVYNNTGASFTPTLTVKHPTARDNYTSSTPVTDLAAVNLQPCANGAWTQVSYSWVASASAALGLEIVLDFGNNFATTSKYVLLTECDLRATPNAIPGLNSASPLPELRAVHTELHFNQRYYVTASVWFGANGGYVTTYTFPSTMRATPSSSDNAGASEVYVTPFGIALLAPGGAGSANFYATAEIAPV